MGGVSKIKVAGNNWGTKETNFRAKITWFEERSEEKEYRIESGRNDAKDAVGTKMFSGGSAAEAGPPK